MPKFLALVLVFFVLLAAACAPTAVSSPEAALPTPEPGPPQQTDPAQGVAVSATAPVEVIPTPTNAQELLPSPDGDWTAVLDRQSGRLELIDAQQNRQELLPAGSDASQALWSPDGRQLAVALNPPSQDGFSGAAEAPKI